MKKLIIYISLAIVAGIFSACDKQDEPVKKPQKEEPKSQNALLKEDFSYMTQTSDS